MEATPHRWEPVYTVTMTDSAGREVAAIVVHREDVETTNGAYRAIADDAAEMVREVLRDHLTIHRGLLA